MAKCVEQTPMVAALEARPKKIGSTCRKLRLSGGKNLIVPGFSRRGNIWDYRVLEKGGPIGDPVLPESTLRAGSDAFEENESGCEHESAGL